MAGWQIADRQTAKPLTDVYEKVVLNAALE
jgi:hypothetical protein